MDLFSEPSRDKGLKVIWHKDFRSKLMAYSEGKRFENPPHPIF